MKREVKCLLFIVIFAVILLAAGCRSKCPDACSDSNACTTDSCSKETGYECAYKTIAGCHIGNKKCEPNLNETKCNAPADCGQCTDKALNVTSNYLQADCGNGDECATDVKEDVASEVPFTTTLNFDSIEVLLNMNLEQPFNVDRDQMQIETELVNIPATVADLTISQIQAIATLNRKEIVVGEAKVDKVLFDVGSKTSDDIRFSYDINSQEITLTDMQIKIYYVYTKKQEGRSDQVIRGSAKYSITSPLIFVDPTRKITCKDISCDDSNSATLDLCKEEGDTAYCSHERLLKVCGNFRCEPDAATPENMCSCPHDCGTCEKNYGTYLEFVCSASKECVSQLRVPTPVPVKTFANEKEAAYFTFNVESSLNQPFKVNSQSAAASDKLKLSIKLIDKKDTLVSAPVFTMVEIFGQNKELLGKKDFSSANQLGSVGSYVNLEVPISFITTTLEQRVTISPKIYYEYTYREEYTEGGQKKTRDVLERESYSFDIASLDFVSPDR